MTTAKRRKTYCLGYATAVGLAGAGFFAEAAQSGPITAQPPVAAPLNDLTPDELARFFVGREAFVRDLEEEEGLGPIFNQTACGDCHLNPLGATGTQVVVRAGLLTKGGKALNYPSLEVTGDA